MFHYEDYVVSSQVNFIALIQFYCDTLVGNTENRPGKTDSGYSECTHFIFNELISGGIFTINKIKIYDYNKGASVRV